MHPADPDQKLIGPDGKEWSFCKFCKCRHTQKIGMYTLSHYSKDHVDNFYKKNGGPEGNLPHLNEGDTCEGNEPDK